MENKPKFWRGKRVYKGDDKNRKGKIICDSCKKLARISGVRQYKGRFLCYICFRKTNPSIKMMEQTANFVLGNGIKSLDEAQEKVRVVKTHWLSSKNNRPTCVIYLPTCYMDKRVKVIVVEEPIDEVNQVKIDEKKTEVGQDS